MSGGMRVVHIRQEQHPLLIDPSATDGDCLVMGNIACW